MRIKLTAAFMAGVHLTTPSWHWERTPYLEEVKFPGWFYTALKLHSLNAYCMKSYRYIFYHNYNCTRSILEEKNTTQSMCYSELSTRPVAGQNAWLICHLWLTTFTSLNHKRWGKNHTNIVIALKKLAQQPFPNFWVEWVHNIPVTSLDRWLNSPFRVCFKVCANFMIPSLVCNLTTQHCPKKPSRLLFLTCLLLSKFMTM